MTVPGAAVRRVQGSYAPEEVEFLLTDLTGHALELPLAEREAAIQAGRNYAEMLPVEYAPDAAYLDLFDRLLERTAADLAEYVGVVTEAVLAARRAPVLVSLARAGTPVGVLLRRWARHVAGREVPHYSVSIVRGVGIDTAALDWIAARHDPSQVVFVDGWTGKGAITTELVDALRAYAAAGGAVFPPDLAVLADPGDCATWAGTLEDEVVPSACLNATVCGLVSRTVYTPRLIAPGQFHGAKVYGDLAAQDRSARFLDAVSARFDEVRGRVAGRLAGGPPRPRRPGFAGRAEVLALQEEFGLPHWHLVKPSVGETTRVLLRRLPWQVLVRPDRRDRLEHLLVLAAQRGVPVVDRPGMRYSAVGLVRPLSGADA